MVSVMPGWFLLGIGRPLYDMVILDYEGIMGEVGNLRMDWQLPQCDPQRRLYDRLLHFFGPVGYHLYLSAIGRRTVARPGEPRHTKPCITLTCRESAIGRHDTPCRDMSCHASANPGRPSAIGRHNRPRPAVAWPTMPGQAPTYLTKARQYYRPLAAVTDLALANPGLLCRARTSRVTIKYGHVISVPSHVPGRNRMGDRSASRLDYMFGRGDCRNNDCPTR